MTHPFAYFVRGYLAIIAIVRRTRIKFCGITSGADALAATEAGADAIGLVFCRSSPRFVDIDSARAIVEALPPWVTPVGLFVDDAVEHVRATAAAVGLTCVQLHGAESPEYAAGLSHFRVLKAIHVNAEITQQLDQWRVAGINGILLETASGQAGGTGIENDWDAIARLRFDGLPPIILAGGLTPVNVCDVVRRLRPYGVDVSSGVEQSKGVKSKEKMEAFAAAVREADAS